MRVNPNLNPNPNETIVGDGALQKVRWVPVDARLKNMRAPETQVVDSCTQFLVPLSAKSAGIDQVPGVKRTKTDQSRGLRKSPETDMREVAQADRGYEWYPVSACGAQVDRGRMVF